MDRFVQSWTVFALITLWIHIAAATEKSCPEDCVCIKGCPAKLRDVCGTLNSRNSDWTDVSCVRLTMNETFKAASLSLKNGVENIGHICNLIKNHPEMRSLSVPVLNDGDQPVSNSCSNFSRLVSLDLSFGNLTKFPFEVTDFESLEILNLSGNALGLYGVLSFDAPNMRVLDLSNNKISMVQLIGSMSNLRTLHLNNNTLTSFPKLYEFSNLTYLDLSFNDLELAQLVGSDCTGILPSKIETLSLRGNNLKRFPENDCWLLEGLSKLKTLDLGENSLTSVPRSYISKEVAIHIETLLLDRNQIYFLSGNAFRDFKNLQQLSLSHNQLKAFPLNFIPLLNRYFAERSFSLNIEIEGNPFKCDCDLKMASEYLTISDLVRMSPDDIICSAPNELIGESVKTLNQSHLQCSDKVYFEEKQTRTCVEGTECEIKCRFTLPDIHWVSPTHKIISYETLLKDKDLNVSYVLFDNGRKLVINDIPLALTGMYRCVANNSFSSAVSFFEVGVLPSPIGSLVAIAVSSVTFALAIAINCFNMCKCYCEALSMEEDLEDAEEKKEDESPLKPSKQLGLHESEASLNANKYYRKYDFACQHIFLDAVVKGAHTVKQTLYDARNSEFSNNVWEYASHLRDRLHIELPSSVHIPRVSMPSISLPTISMPNISMPNMPNLQSINSNIERLGTSVISRSQNFATSVGSVFTLRWLKYGANENDSDSDTEQASVSQVQAHVHESKDCCDAEDATASTSLLEVNEGERGPRVVSFISPQTDSSKEHMVPISQSGVPEEVLDNPPNEAIEMEICYQFETTV